MRKAARKSTIVAVRMPRSLLEELRELKNINHFMDISDEIRFVVRKYLNNVPQEKEMFVELKRKEKLIQDLSKIIKQLKGEEDER